MDGITRKRLTEWMHRMVFNESTERGPLVKFAVRHTKASGQQSGEVGTVTISSDVNSPEEIPLWAATIDNMTIADATGIGGNQRYAINAYFKGEDGVVNAGPRYILRVYGGAEDGEDAEDGSIEATEAPTAKGQLAQSMRHTEIAFKMSIGSTAQIIATLQRENARLSSQNEQLIARQLENLETMENLKTQRHERELASSTALIKQDALRDMSNKAMHLLPLVVNAIAKKRIMQEKTTPTEQLVHSLFQSLKPAQFEGLLAQLTPEQQANLLAVGQNMFQFEAPKANEDGKPLDGTERANQNANGSTAMTIIKA